MDVLFGLFWSGCISFLELTTACLSTRTSHQTGKHCGIRTGLILLSVSLSLFVSVVVCGVVPIFSLSLSLSSLVLSYAVLCCDVLGCVVLCCVVL